MFLYMPNLENANNTTKEELFKTVKTSEDW